MIAYHVWQESSFLLYDMFYRKIRGVWNERAQLLYANTDSILVSISKVENYYADLQKLSDQLDFSPVPQDVCLYDSSHARLHGRWKFEAFYIKQFLSMHQKSYSILQLPSKCMHSKDEYCLNCTKCKGFRRGVMSHKLYLDVITKRDFGIYYYQKVKNHLGGNLKLQTFSRQFGLSEGNRVWVADNESLPFGHYALKLYKSLN